MTSYSSRQEFAEKANWEGGLLEFIFGYGVTVEELPDGDTELRDLVEKILTVKPEVDRLEELLLEFE